MTVDEARAYFIDCNERIISVAKDENGYNYETQQIENVFMRRTFEANESAIKALEQAPKTGWIPIKTRPLTNKEKEEYADLGYSEDSIDSMYDCHLPNDGEEVLITTRYDEVTTDTFYRDEGCYFETYCDKDDVKAWMHLPTPYKGERDDEE